MVEGGVQNISFYHLFPCFLPFVTLIFFMNKSDKSQEQAKQGQMFWQLMLFPAVFSIWEGVIKENWWWGDTINFAEGWKLF